jgi:predicted oxidoreductase
MSTRREFLSRSVAAGFVAAVTSRSDQAVAQAKPADPRNTLRTYKVPRTDLEVSRMAYGCAMLGLDWNSPDFVARTVPLIHIAYENGITFFDLADVYGHGKAELALAEFLKQRPGTRNRIVIQSKCGDRFREGSVDNSRAHILRAVEGSLKRLATNHLDILLLHWPDGLVEPQEVAQAFDQLHAAGKVRYFGVSNHSPYQIEILQKHVRQPLVANQIQLGLAHWVVRERGHHLTHGVDGVAVVDYCYARDIQVQAYSPLRVATRSGKPTSLIKPSDDASPAVKRAAQVLASIAKRHDTTPAVVMLAWLLRHPAGIVPIIGALKPEYVIENCTADRVDLTREEWYALLNAAAAMQSANDL